MTPDQARQLWERNSSRYFEEVGRLAVATSQIEFEFRRIIHVRHAYKVAATTGEFYGLLLFSDAEVELRPRATFSDLAKRMRTVVATLPAEWAAQAGRTLDELDRLVNVRHEHVHRVLMMRDGATHEVLVYKDGDDRLHTEAPDLAAMRRTSDRLDQLCDHIGWLATRPGLAELAPAPGANFSHPPLGSPPRYPEPDE